MKYYEQSIMIKDSLNRQSNIKALHEKIKYEYEKRTLLTVFFTQKNKKLQMLNYVLNAELRSQIE